MAAKIRAGNLRKKITIQRNYETLDSTNAAVPEWINLNQVRADLESIKGDELFISDTIKGEVDYYIIIRKTDITNKDRIIFNGEIYEIKYVLNENERSVRYLIFAKKRTDLEFILERSDWLLEDGFSLLAESGDYLINEGV